ncbi:hypothetical protein C8F01DRAFT_1121186, partial [Mycena amicta]
LHFEPLNPGWRHASSGSYQLQDSTARSVCSGSSTSSKTRVASKSNRCLRCYHLGTLLFAHHRFQQAQPRSSPSPPVSPNAFQILMSLTPGICDIPSYDIHIRSFVGLSHTLVYRTLSRILLLTRPSSNDTSLCCSAASSACLVRVHSPVAQT